MPGSAPIPERFSVSVATTALLAAATCLNLSSAAAGPQPAALVPYVIVGDSIPASLEFFLLWRARGMKVEAPAVRP